MPAFRIASASRRMPVFALALVALSIGAAPAVAAEPPSPKVENSALDAPLFYQLLLSEIELRNGQAGTAYQLMLDAARRGKDEQLFRRATEMALQARAGDQALSAVLAWRQALPESADALRYQIQLLVALNRIADVEEPLSALLRQTARPALPGLIEALPRLLGRAADRNAVAAVVERTLRPYADAADTKAPASVAIGRAWLVAGDTAKALAFAQRASEADPGSEGAALLALDMLPGTPEAEAIVKRQLAARADNPTVRLLYVRTLADVAAPGRGDGRDRGADQERSQPRAAVADARCARARDEAPARSGGRVAQLRSPGRGRCGREFRRRRERAARHGRRRRGRHAAQREHGVDPGLPPARAGVRAAAGFRRRRALARARRQPAAGARGAGAARIAAGAPGQDEGSARADPQGSRAIARRRARQDTLPRPSSCAIARCTPRPSR